MQVVEMCSWALSEGRRVFLCDECFDKLAAKVEYSVGSVIYSGKCDQVYGCGK